jgi:hypothetical protein
MSHQLGTCADIASCTVFVYTTDVRLKPRLFLSVSEFAVTGLEMATTAGR